MSEYLNKYVCPSCAHNWHDVWDCGVDDECPNCKYSDISPVDSKLLGDENLDISIELTSYEWHSLLNELMYKLRFKNENVDAAKFLYEKIASQLHNKPVVLVIK